LSSAVWMKKKTKNSPSKLKGGQKRTRSRDASESRLNEKGIRPYDFTRTRYSMFFRLEYGESERKSAFFPILKKKSGGKKKTFRTDENLKEKKR